MQIEDLDVDVEGTAMAIENMAKTLEDYAEELRRDATKLREKKDMIYASSALQCISNCMGNLRLDLIITRPIRSINHALRTVDTVKTV